MEVVQSEYEVALKGIGFSFIDSTPKVSSHQDGFVEKKIVSLLLLFFSFCGCLGTPLHDDARPDSSLLTIKYQSEYRVGLEKFPSK